MLVRNRIKIAAPANPVPAFPQAQLFQKIGLVLLARHERSPLRIKPRTVKIKKVRVVIRLLKINIRVARNRRIETLVAFLKNFPCKRFLLRMPRPRLGIPTPFAGPYRAIRSLRHFPLLPAPAAPKLIQAPGFLSIGSGH